LSAANAAVEGIKAMNDTAPSVRSIQEYHTEFDND
jgi:hypothetical protein